MYTVGGAVSKGLSLMYIRRMLIITWQKHITNHSWAFVNHHMQTLKIQVKNQAGCASSWAFSATGALEGQYYRATRKLESFSEQQLLDCSEGYGNQGCEGGLSTNTFRYVQHQGGICTEGNYPYLGYVSYEVEKGKKRSVCFLFYL